MATDTYFDKTGRLGAATLWLLSAATIAIALATLAWLSAGSAQAQGGSTPPDTPQAPELPDSDNLDFAAVSANCSSFDSEGNRKCGAGDFGVVLASDIWDGYPRQI